MSYKTMPCYQLNMKKDLKAQLMKAIEIFMKLYTLEVVDANRFVIN